MSEEARDDGFSKAVEAIYAAAATPALWPSALQSVADCFGDVGGVLLFRREDGGFGTIVSPALEPVQASYERDWWKQDIRAARAVDYGFKAHAGALTDRHLITPEEIDTHPFYTEFLVPAGLGWVAGVGVAPTGLEPVSLSVQRARAKPPFADEELALLTRIGRHAEQALRLSLRLMGAELANLELGLALDRLSIAAFVVAADGRVIFSNSRGQALVGRGLAVEHGRLALASAADTQRLLGGLGRLRGAILSRDHPQAMIAGTGGEHPLVIHILPVARQAAGPMSLLTEASAILLVIDGSSEAPSDPALLRELYGLTLGEARVAALVGAGLSPSRSARRLGVSEATVRSTLKRVFQQLGVSRQAELVAFLARVRAPR